jgi:hypothetical protein
MKMSPRTVALAIVAGALIVGAVGCNVGSSRGCLPLYAAAGDGAAACKQLSEDLQQTSSNWAVAAWAAGIVGGLLTALGGIVGAGQEKDHFMRRAAGVLLATLGSSLAATAAYSVSRSNAASTAAASASMGQTESDDVARFNSCLKARAEWLDSRVDSLDQAAPPQARKGGGGGPPKGAPDGGASHP